MNGNDYQSTNKREREIGIERERVYVNKLKKTQNKTKAVMETTLSIEESLYAKKKD